MSYGPQSSRFHRAKEVKNAGFRSSSLDVDVKVLFGVLDHDHGG